MESFRIHLGSLDQVPLGQGRCFSIGFHEVAVFRGSDGRLFAVESRCPQGRALVEGILNGYKIECCAHGHTFDLFTGQGVGVQESVRTFKIWEENGNIMLLFVFPTIAVFNNHK
jgi:nitrite reductase (NADH) small subunit